MRADQLASDLDFEALALNAHLRLGFLHLKFGRDVEADDEFAIAKRIATHVAQWPRVLKSIEGLIECARREGQLSRVEELLEEANLIRQRTLVVEARSY